MYKRLLMAIVFGLLAWGSVSAQESGARSATSFQLKGVLISKSERTALVNGKLVQEGDRFGGIEVLAIDQGGIRLLTGAGELAVDVGGTFVGDRSSRHVARLSHTRTSQRENQDQRVAVRAVSIQDSSEARFYERSRHTVKSGETLSAIALRYRGDDVTMNQMMIALFEANLQAFDDNINVLYEGAILRIPDQNERIQLAPETATAEVVRHTDMWHAAQDQGTIISVTTVANASDRKQYGPVESGETLSAIAASVLPDGATVNQTMIALFEANPHAFSDNINVLYEGAILRIPDDGDLRRQTPDMATTEVMRQSKAWQSGREQYAVLTLAQNNVTASGNELIN